MKQKLLLICVALLCAVGSWATEYYTRSFTLTGRSASDWSEIKHVIGKREYEVCVNNTNNHLLVYGWNTGSTGLTAGWNNCDLAVRYLPTGAIVKFTLGAADQASNFTLHSLSNVTRSVDGNVVTITFNNTDGHMFEMRSTTNTVVVTKIDISYPIPSTYNYSVKGLGSDAWTTISPNVVGNARTYEVSVNGTDGNLLVWGWTTGSGGVTASGNWLAVRNLSQGDQVDLTFASGSSPSNVTYNPSGDETQLTSSTSGQVLTTNIIANRRMFELTPTASATIEKLSITRNRIDMTGFIKNPRFVDSDVTNNNLTSLSGWTLSRTGGNGNLKSTIAEFWNCTFDVNQTINNLPNGKYVVSVKATSKDGKGELYATANAITTTTALTKTSNNDNFGAIVTELNKSHGDAHRKSVVAYVTNNELTVGVKQTESHNGDTWIVLGDFSLTYEGPTLATDAVALTGSMEAGKWYYFTADADDKWIDAPTPSDIVFETDGNKLTSTEGTALSEMTMTSGTKYYIKSSSAQTVTVSEQTIANGTYYLYSPYTGLFLGSGANYGTAAFVDKYGVPFDLELHADGYMLKFVDWNKYLYSDAWLFVDGANGAKFKITESTVGDYTGYAFYNKAATSNNRLYVYLKDNGDKYRVAGNAIIGDNCDEVEQTVWQFKSVEEHNTIVNAYPTDNINHVITAASIGDKTDAAGFESYLSTYYDANDMTDKIGTAKFGDNAGDWTWTQVENRSGSDGYRYETAWQYQRTGSYTQTIAAANLPAGVYKVEMGGFDRHASESSDISLASSYGSLSSSYLKANDEQVRMKAWADVEGRPTTGETQANSINSGAADNVVYVYLDGSTDLNLKVCKPAYLAECYFNFGNFRLTRYTLKDADEADYTALNTAIAAAEAHTLGFESGEYAPYNNIERLSELANAKAIDQEAENTKEMVDASTNALNDGAWTVNVGDVECVYNGDFANGQGSPAANIQDYGWTRTNGWGQFRSDSDQSSTSNGTSYYNQPGSLQYGNAGYYTMPLKANTIYQLTFKYASWEANSNNWVKASVLKSGEGMAAVKYEKNATVHTTAGAFVAKTILFVTTTAGDYVLTLANSGNTVITDVSITKAANQYLEFADGSVPNYAPGTYPSVKITRTLTANRWATAVYPFAVQKSSDLAIATISEYDKETGELTFDAPDASTANTPFLMRSTAGASEISLSDVTVAAASVTNATASEAHLIGTYSETDITNAEKNYVLSNNVIYPVGDAGAKIPAYRAYIQIDQDALSAKALTLVFNDEATAVSEVKNEGMQGEKSIYNLAGQRMNKLQRGVNIVNGKKLLVK